MIDWRLARATGARLGGRGPEVSLDEASGAVDELRHAATRAQEPVRAFTGLDAPLDATPVLVVDRPRWISANLETFSTLLEPALTQIDRRTNPLSRGVSGKVGGAQVGAAMALVSSRVLGQFDPFAADGRLLLVAPNIVQVERKLEVDPTDFRMWVCLHEETHRVQFTANPWLRDHLRSLIESFLDQTDTDAIGQLADRVVEALRHRKEGASVSLADLFQSPEQKALIEQATGVMSLLEGHADVVMDGVGPAVVPTVRKIRRKFTQRRESAGPIDSLVRKLLGMEGKLRQYKEGADFVRTVTRRVGMDGFNAIWTEPATLPTHDEILDPASWIARVAP